jgi:pimeloyl-ACP methyl ester carboxylesterase
VPTREARQTPNKPLLDGGVVVYVHGLWMAGAEGLLLRRRLARERGFDLRAFHYHSVSAPLGQIVEALRVMLEGLRGEQVHLLGHSLGGLVILECLRRYRLERPGRVVLLGSPLLGSRTAARLGRIGLARALLGRAVCEQLLTPQTRQWASERELGVISGSMPLGFGRLVTLRFGEENDGTIAVSETHIPGARAYLTLPVSHLGLLLSARVAHEVGSFLQHGCFGM